MSWLRCYALSFLSHTAAVNKVLSSVVESTIPSPGKNQVKQRDHNTHKYPFSQEHVLKHAGPFFRIGQIPGPEKLQGYAQNLGEEKIQCESHSHLFNSIDAFGGCFPSASIGQTHVSTLPWPTLLRTECVWGTSKLHHCPQQFYMDVSLCLFLLLLLTLCKFSTLWLKCLHWFSNPISFC